MKIFRGPLLRHLSMLVVLAVAVCQAARPGFKRTVFETNVPFAQGIYAVGDIDGDGKNEIVACGATPSRIYWMKYPDLTTKHVIANTGNVGYEVHLADVNNDGRLDVMTSEHGVVTWYENPGPQNLLNGQVWKEHICNPTSGPTSGTGNAGGSHDFKVGDINHDGKIDAVLRDQGMDHWVVFMQQSPDSWVSCNVPAHQAGEGTALGDIDVDGDLDLSDGWAWFECPADPLHGTWTQHTIGNATHNLTRVVIVDINGDGHADVVSAPSEFGGSKLIYWQAPADPKTGAWTEYDLYTAADPNFHTLQIGDIDLDGYPDILVASTGDPQDANTPAKMIKIYYNVKGDGSVWQDTTWYDPVGIWQGILGDVKTNGTLSILGCNYNGAACATVLENLLVPATAVREKLIDAPRADRTEGPAAEIVPALSHGQGRLRGPAVDASGRTLGGVREKSVKVIIESAGKR